MSDPDDKTADLQPLGDLGDKVADLRARLEGEAEGPPADPDAIQDAADEAVLEARRIKEADERLLAGVGAYYAGLLDRVGERQARKVANAEQLPADVFERILASWKRRSVDPGSEAVPAKGSKRKRSAKETGLKGEKGESETAEGGDSDLPRLMGFDLDAMNREFALVLLGSKAVVYLERPDAPIDDQQRFISLEAFNAWFRNRYTEFKAADGKWKVVSWATAWLQSKKRRSFHGIEFHPMAAHERSGGSRGYLNIWSGFAIEPKADPPGECSWKLFRKHLLENVCGGDEAIFQWVFAFFADIVQNPRERAGVSLVLRGPMGSGKTKVGEVFGSLFPRHYFLVDDPRYVTGQFNAHMASCLLLQADEAVWAGDKAAEGRLKGLITSPFQQIEAKGIDAIRLKNHVRLVMTSNEDWVVPAGKDERRFCVLDVGKAKAQDNSFFAAMDGELDAGGRAALLHALQTFDLGSVNLRKIPRTAALLEQKIRSFDSVDHWWFERLMAGSVTRKGRIWPSIVSKSVLVDDYVEATERLGVKRKRSETEVGMALRKLMPKLETVRGYCQISEDTATRRWCFRLPDLHLCRHAFEQAVQQTVDWPSTADDEAEGDRFEGVETL